MADALRDEMALRSHNHADAMVEIGCGFESISRWLSPHKTSIPGSNVGRGWEYVRGLIKYLRLEDDQEFGKLWFNSMTAMADRKKRMS